MGSRHYNTVISENKSGITLYELGVVIISAKLILMSSSVVSYANIIDNCLVAAFIVLMLIKIIKQQYSTKFLFCGSLIGLLCLYSSLQCGNYNLVMTFFAIFAIQNENFRNIIKRMCATKAVLLFLHVLFYLPEVMFSSENISFTYRGDQIRHSFFFDHPNVFSMFVLWTLLEYCYLLWTSPYYEKNPRSLIGREIIVAIIALGTYHTTGSRTLMMVMASVIVFLFISNTRIGKASIDLVSKYGYFVLSIIFVVGSIIYYTLTGPLKLFGEGLNVSLSGRLALGAYQFKHTGWTLLGKFVDYSEQVEWDNEYRINILGVDNAYIKFFVNYGLLFLIIIAISLIVINKYLNKIEKIFVIAYIVYGITESFTTNALLCFPMLFIGKVFFERYISSRDEE